MVYLGIDVGGTNIAAGVVNEEYRITASAKLKTKLGCTAEETGELLAKAAEEALRKAGASLDDVKWVGAGSPGAVNRDTGKIDFINNIPQFVGFPLRDYLANRLGKPAYIENDANAAAYGEYKAGALKGTKNSLAITIGTGIGSGIIIDGKIYAGANFAGGEMGHMVIVKDGRPCTCGRRGCWERYSAATGLISMTKEAMQMHPDAKIIWDMVGNDLNNVDGRTSFDAMRAGDPLGKAVVDEYISYLACGIANCINILQPAVICIGGGICNEGETLLAPLRKLVAKEVYSKIPEHETLIVRAQLGNDAGIIGAALLGCQ